MLFDTGTQESDVRSAVTQRMTEWHLPDAVKRDVLHILSEEGELGVKRVKTICPQTPSRQRGADYYKDPGRWLKMCLKPYKWRTRSKLGIICVDVFISLAHLSSNGETSWFSPVVGASIYCIAVFLKALLDSCWYLNSNTALYDPIYNLFSPPLLKIFWMLSWVLTTSFNETFACRGMSDDWLAGRNVPFVPEGTLVSEINLFSREFDRVEAFFRGSPAEGSEWLNADNLSAFSKILGCNYIQLNPYDPFLQGTVWNTVSVEPTEGSYYTVGDGTFLKILPGFVLIQDNSHLDGIRDWAAAGPVLLSNLGYMVLRSEIGISEESKWYIYRPFKDGQHAIAIPYHKGIWSYFFRLVVLVLYVEDLIVRVFELMFRIRLAKSLGPELKRYLDLATLFSDLCPKLKDQVVRMELRGLGWRIKEDEYSDETYIEPKSTVRFSDADVKPPKFPKIEKKRKSRQKRGEQQEAVLEEAVFQLLRRTRDGDKSNFRGEYTAETFKPAPREDESLMVPTNPAVLKHRTSFITIPSKQECSVVLHSFGDANGNPYWGPSVTKLRERPLHRLRRFFRKAGSGPEKQKLHYPMGAKQRAPPKWLKAKWTDFRTYLVLERIAGSPTHAYASIHHQPESVYALINQAPERGFQVDMTRATDCLIMGAMMYRMFAYLHFGETTEEPSASTETAPRQTSQVNQMVVTAFTDDERTIMGSYAQHFCNDDDSTESLMPESPGGIEFHAAADLTRLVDIMNTRDVLVPEDGVLVEAAFNYTAKQINEGIVTDMMSPVPEQQDLLLNQLLGHMSTSDSSSGASSVSGHPVRVTRALSGQKNDVDLDNMAELVEQQLGVNKSEPSKKAEYDGLHTNLDRNKDWNDARRQRARTLVSILTKLHQRRCSSGARSSLPQLPFKLLNRFFDEEEMQVVRKTTAKLVGPTMGDRGISGSFFVRFFTEMYEILATAVGRAEMSEILDVFTRIVNISMLVVALVVILLLAGINTGTVLVSGAAALATVSGFLSYLYHDYSESVLLTCIINPYNVGERVVINGQLGVCERIHTFFSTFLMLDGKSIAMNHSVLAKTQIINYSRSTTMSQEINFRIDPNTPDIKYRTLDELLYQYCQNNPDTIMPDTYCFLITAIQPNHFMQCVIYVSCPLSWHFIFKGYEIREQFLMYLKDMCHVLGISYFEPVSRIVPDEHMVKAFGGKLKKKHHRIMEPKTDIDDTLKFRFDMPQG